MSFIDEIYKQGGRVFEVGGAVRDRLWGLPHKDQDLLVTQIPFPHLIELLRSQGKVLEVGKSFGVLKFKPRRQDVEYDIALPRTERSTGEGHRDFEVNFDEKLPVEADLKRRDFTINAIARELTTGELIDPYGGQADLKTSTLRQVFPECFLEDPLRLLRAVQFAARFGLTIEEETFKAMRENAFRIETVSAERVIEEIAKLFKAEEPSRGFELMRDTQILPHVFPTLAPMSDLPAPGKQSRSLFEHTMRVVDACRADPKLRGPGDRELMFAALFHSSGEVRTSPKTQSPSSAQDAAAEATKSWLRRYRASMLGVKDERIVALVRYHAFDIESLDSEAAIRRFIHRIGRDLIFPWIDLQIADRQDEVSVDPLDAILRFQARVEEVLAKNPPLSLRELAVDGNTLMELGYPQGRTLGLILNRALEAVLEDPERNDRDRLIEYIAGHFPKRDFT